MASNNPGQGTSQQIKEQVRTTASRVADQAHDVASGAVEKADTALSQVGKQMSSLAGTIREKGPQEGVLGTAASTVAGNLSAGGDYLQEHGLGDMGRDLTRLVQRHPMPALLMAFGVGCLMGMSRSRR